MKCNGLCQRVTAIGYGIALAVLIGIGMKAAESDPEHKPGTAPRIAPPSRVSTAPSVAGDKTGTVSTTWDR